MFQKSLTYFFCGLAMGAADVVPGVSGGTVAYITGIYEKLLASLGSFDAAFFRFCASLKWRQALERVNWQFLLPLALGILLSIFSLARVILALLTQWPDMLWGFFSGLILASIIAMGRSLPLRAAAIVPFLLGILAAWHISGLDALQSGHGPLTVFASGFIALCAMILPGISGSFMLVLLGQYAHILQAVTGLKWQTLLIFAAGGLCGLLTFSKVLSHCFCRFPAQTNAAMIGVMAGCLRLAWPWQSGGALLWPQSFGPRECAVVGAFAIGCALPAVLQFCASLKKTAR